MFGSKLFGLVLCTLIGATPVNFTTADGTFPQTRDIGLRAVMTYDVYDLGYAEDVDLLSAGSGLEAQYETVKHEYAIAYHFNIYCNQACSLAGAVENGYNLTSDQVSYHIQRRYSLSAKDLYTNVLGSLSPHVFVANSTVTYTFDTDIQQLSFQATLYNYTVTVTVNFPAQTEGNILNHLDNKFSNWALWDGIYQQKQIALLMNILNNSGNGIPSNIMTQYQTAIENNDYDTAYTIINNYYTTHLDEVNDETNNKITNYNTKDTTLNNYFNTENNFTNQIETDFQQQEQQLPDLSDSIDELQTPTFLSSANWVTVQFNRMTNGNIFGSFLTFSLLTGFIMALIGRFKR